MKKIIFFVLINLFAVIVCCNLQAINQNYYFKNFSVEDGLSQNTVNAILQDREGFMWFGTKDGLNRYDGLLFRQYKYNSNDIHSLGNNFVTSLYED